MKKLLDYISRTIEDKIVKDGLCAVGELSNFTNSKGLYMVVGGIATQSYLPDSYRRPTFDIDLSVGRPLNYAEFKEFSKPVREFMGDNGYAVGTKKASRSYHLDISAKDGDSLLVEFARRNSNNFNESKKRLLRELDNARNKTIEGRDASCYFSSPEDIVTPKLARSTNSLKRNPGFNKYLTELLGSFSEDDIKRQLKRIKEFREEAIYHVGDPFVSEQLRFVSDLYDIRLLAEKVGFNEHYLFEAASDWTSLRECSKERNHILTAVLPNKLESFTKQKWH